MIDRREPSLRAAARERFRALAEAQGLYGSAPEPRREAGAPEPPPDTPLPDPPPQEPAPGRAQARPGWGREPTEQVAREPAEQDTPLTDRVRDLYENSVVPVREIARLAGVTERTIYKYAERGGWKQRVKRFARGAGGRFIPAEDAGKPHACGLKALDPEGARQASAQCERAGRLAEEAAAAAAAAAQARAAAAKARAIRVAAAKATRARLRTFTALKRALANLRRLEEKGFAAESDANRVTVRLVHALLDQIDRLQARRPD